MEPGLNLYSSEKTRFISTENHYALKGRKRFRIYGVKLEGDTPAGEGANLLQDGKKVRTVIHA